VAEVTPESTWTLVLLRPGVMAHAPECPPEHQPTECRCRVFVNAMIAGEYIAAQPDGSPA
jgi:hypothetical protein